MQWIFRYFQLVFFHFFRMVLIKLSTYCFTPTCIFFFLQLLENHDYRNYLFSCVSFFSALKTLHSPWRYSLSLFSPKLPVPWDTIMNNFKDYILCMSSIVTLCFLQFKIVHVHSLVLHLLVYWLCIQAGLWHPETQFFSHYHNST